MGCRQVADPGALVRVSCAPGGVLVTGPGPGRGAWLCRDGADCLERAVRHGALGRALRAEVAPGAIDRLRKLVGRDALSGEGAVHVCEDGGSGRSRDPHPHEEERP